MRDDGSDAPSQPCPDPKTQDIMGGDRRLSRPDSSLPDWEMPDTAYRPIPIVWFTGAFFVHFIATHIILFVLPLTPLWVPIGLAAVIGGAVLRWTWDRGMSGAGNGWKIATYLMLAVNMLYLSAIASSV